MASTGNASLLLSSEQIALLFFGIPIKLNEATKCGIVAYSTKVYLLGAVKQIIWDEVPIYHRLIVEW